MGEEGSHLSVPRSPETISTEELMTKIDGHRTRGDWLSFWRIIWTIRNRPDGAEKIKMCLRDNDVNDTIQFLVSQPNSTLFDRHYEELKDIIEPVGYFLPPKKDLIERRKICLGTEPKVYNSQ